MAVTHIDFSPMHDVWIRSADGSLQRMDEPYYKSELVAPGIWKIKSDGDSHYLVEGDTEALAIDTGYGAGNLREYLQTLTDKPVRRVANTHYHFDHTANNPYFEAAYMSAEAIPLATVPYKSFESIHFTTDYEHIVVREGDVIDLGGRQLEVIELAGHTRGSLAFLDRKNRVLFTGDEMDKFVNLTRSVADFVRSMEKLAAVRSEVDLCFGGHGLIDLDNIDKLIALGRDILSGKLPEGEGGGPKGGPGGPKGPGGPGGPEVDEGGEPAPEGATVYSRERPRPGDGGAGAGGQEFRRMASGYGVRILYDIRNIAENKADLY